VNHEYWRSEQLVNLLHETFGFHPGWRAVHGLGRMYAGTCTATPEAKQYTRAVHMQGDPTPVTARFSYSFPDMPNRPAAAQSAMATKFYLPSGQVTDLIALSHSLFPFRTPEEVLDLLNHMRDPVTDKPDPARVQAWMADHPASARAQQIIQSEPPPASFAQAEFHPIHVYRFVNAAEEARYARYHWIPEAGLASTTIDELRQRGEAYMFEELEERLRSGPVAYSLVLQLAEEGDPLNDTSAPWPDDREIVTIGRMELTRPTTNEEIGDPVMLHDPTRVTDGIEISDDPILQARRGVYEASAAHRTGGWKGREAVLEREAILEREAAQRRAAAGQANPPPAES
jgi:catalase